jgi:hypothetical protein
MFKLCFTNSWNDFEQALPCTWDVVQLVITQQEGHVAKASLAVGNFKVPPAPYMAIFEDEVLLFQGMVSGQFEHQQHLTKVQVLSIPPTFEADLKALLSNKSLAYNPAFFQSLAPKPSDYLESDNQLFYWDRVTGKIGLSDYFKGSKCIDVSGKYIDTTFKMHQIAMPLGRVVVTLKVHWMQTLEGAFNAAPYIARAFPNKIVATLTPNTVINHWPLEDQRLGVGKRQSGYRVEVSKITSATAPGLPSYTQAVCTKVSEVEKSLRAKIHYFNPTLKIHWQYHQPRIEQIVLQGQLNHIQHKFTGHRVHHIPISIELPSSEQVIFFETKKGEAFIEYASHIIQAQLKASSRCIQVLCTLPWELGRDLTIDDSLKAEGKFSGKITKVRHVINGLQKKVEVTVACVLQSGDLINAQTPGVCDYAQEPWNADIYSNEGLRGITHPKLYPKDLITQIQVKNSAPEQEAYLLQNQYPVRDNIDAVLQEVPTSIHLHLKDLRTDKPLVRNFEKTLGVVEVPNPSSC